VPFIDDTIDGGHEWYTWRKLLHDYAAGVAFRTTKTAVTISGTSVTATVTPGTTEPVAPTGTVQFSAAGTPLGAPVALVNGSATISVSNTNGPGITATYSGDAFYTASNGSYPYSASSGGVGGTVPATLSLTLGAPASFGAFTPGVTKDYTASTTANVISTAGDATLSVSDPGHLMNGTYTLPSPLTVSFSKASWTAPVSNDPVTIAFDQHIDSGDALRTGDYSKTLTFTLSTTQPS
jgi:hypothetical protein